MQTDLRECYRLLEVEPGAPLDEVKRAYRELVKVWHPDRFTHDPKLQRKAQEKLKQINAAYERICLGGPIPQATGSNNPSSSGTTTQHKSPPPPPRPAPAPERESNWKRRFAQAAIAIVVIAVLKAVFSTKDNPPARSVESQPSYSAPRPTYQAPQQSRSDVQPKVPRHLSIAQISELHQEALKRQPGLGMTLREFSRYAQDKLPDYDFSEGINYSPPEETLAPKVESSVATATPNREPAVEDSTPSPPHASQSVPSSSSMVADSSAVEHDSAISRVPSVLPQIFERRDYFTVGSTKEEVLAVQGTPSEFTDSTFTYGYSRVHFRGDRVTTWEDRQTNPLRVKLLPTAGIERKTYFTVGSTKDEVLAVQGTPTEFTDSPSPTVIRRCISEATASRRGKTVRRIRSG